MHCPLTSNFLFLVVPRATTLTIEGLFLLRKPIDLTCDDTVRDLLITRRGNSHPRVRPSLADVYVRFYVCACVFLCVFLCVPYVCMCACRLYVFVSCCQCMHEHCLSPFSLGRSLTSHIHQSSIVRLLETLVQERVGPISVIRETRGLHGIVQGG